MVVVVDGSADHGCLLAESVAGWLAGREGERKKQCDAAVRRWLSEGTVLCYLDQLMLLSWKK